MDYAQAKTLVDGFRDCRVVLYLDDVNHFLDPHDYSHGYRSHPSEVAAGPVYSGVLDGIQLSEGRDGTDEESLLLLDRNEVSVAVPLARIKHFSMLLGTQGVVWGE